MTEGPKNTGEGGAANGAVEPNEWELMAQEAAKEAAKENGQNPDDVTEDDVEYQKKLAELARRGTDFDQLSNEEIEKNETNMGINANGEAYQRMPWNTWDNYARIGKDANREHFDANNAWKKRIETAMADMGQGENESPEDFKKRVLSAAYSEVAAEQAADPERRLNEVELDSLRMSYPRQEGESTMAWAKRISDETGVRFGAGKVAEVSQAIADEVEAENVEPNVDEDEFLKQCKDWYERLGDAKSKFEKMDGESDADYERRMNTVVISNMSTEIANHEDRKLNDVEYGKVTEMYPRQQDEDYDAYIARVKDETGIDLRTAVATRKDMGVDDSNNDFKAPDFVRNVVDQNPGTEIIERTAEAGNEEEEAKKARIEKMRSIMGSELFENMRKKYNISDEDLKNLSDEEIELAFDAYKQQLEDWAKMPVEEGGAGYNDEELKKMAAGGDKNIADLMARFNEYIGKNLETENDDAESAEQMEKLREAMIRGMSIADLRDMLEAEGVKVDDMENMDAEQLKELQEKLRKRMFDAFGADNGIGDYLERDDIKVDDLEEKDFEGMKDQREVYRQEFIHDLSEENLADKLKDRDIRIDDLEAMTMEELLALKKELAAAEKEPADQTEDGEQEKPKDPLIAVMVDRERDAKIAARAMAEDMFQDKLIGNGKKGLGRIMRNLIFGQMLKDSTMLKYEREAMEAITSGDSEVRGRKVGEYWSSDGDGASGKVVERLTLAYTAGVEDSLLHSEAGNTMDAYGMEIDENGNQVVYKYSEGGNKKEAVDADSAEAKSTIAVHEAIAAFASGKMSEADFEEAMKREKANMAKEGLDTSLMSDTLLETAKAAKERFNHEESIENVMEGFRLINADYQAQVRTEVHRSKIDEISEKISGKLGIVQPEVIAAAAGIAVFFTQKATTSALRAAVPVVGGALAAGAFAGFKEHNRVAVDRAEQARRIARGEQIGDTKYDRQMKETEYTSFEASKLTETLKAAIESGNVESIQKGLATIEALTHVSDSEKIDLIKFSGGDNTTIEDERLALDVQIAQAKVELRKQGIDDKSKVFVEASDKAYEAIRSDMEAKDAAFKKLQAKRVAAQVAKTAAIGVATAVVGQEVSAAFNPDSYGLFDKMNDTLDIRFTPLNIGVNNLNAHKTLLAGFLGINQEQITTTIETVTAAEATGAKLTDEQVNQLRQEGYTVNERTVTTTETVTNTETISAADYARENGVYISRNWGSNGTEYSDGNELGLWQADDGHLYTHMSGNSYGGGMTVNFNEAAQSGNVKLLVSLTRDSQSTPIEVPGILNSSGQLDFVSDDPAINEIINSGQYAFAEVAYGTGNITSSGAEQMFIFATETGSNSVADEFTREVTDTIVNTDTVFDVIGFERQATTILEGSDLIKGGVAIPFASRKNLTRGKKGQGHKPSGPQTIDNGGDTSKPEPNQPNNETGGETKRPTPPSPEPNRPTGEPTTRAEQEPKPEPAKVEQEPAKPVIEQKPAAEQNPENGVKVPERAPGDTAPIVLTGDQIRSILEGQDGADIYQARMENEISKWNALTVDQRSAILKGDYSGFEGSEKAEVQHAVDFLKRFDVLKDAPIGTDYEENNNFSSETDLGGPWGNVVTRVEFTDEEIDALESDEGWKKQLKENIRVWNSASEQERRDYIMGNTEVGTPINDAGLMLMNSGRSYIGNAADVAKVREEARATIEARFQSKLEEAKKNAAQESITDPSFSGELMFPDEKIREMNPGVEIPGEDLSRMRRIMYVWNRISPAERQSMLHGDFDRATRNPKMNGYLRQHFGLMKKYGIFRVDGEGISDEGEAKAA